MLRVLCIEDKPIYAKAQAPDPWILKSGEVYEVARTVRYLNKWDYYELEIQKGVAYPVEFFVPVSDIDEKDIRRNRAVDKWLNEMITVK